MEELSVEEQTEEATVEIINMVKVQGDAGFVDLDYVITHDNFTFALCNFLDEFKRNNKKIEMIENPPKSDGANRKNLCILAAVAHKLANDYKLNVPEWVHLPLYRMPYPVFSYDTTNEEFRKFLIDVSPPEFAEKNIYYGPNAIDRV